MLTADTLNVALQKDSPTLNSIDCLKVPDRIGYFPMRINTVFTHASGFRDGKVGLSVKYLNNCEIISHDILQTFVVPIRNPYDSGDPLKFPLVPAAGSQLWF